MPFRRRAASPPIPLDGTFLLPIRGGLIVLAVSVLAFLPQLPRTATTHGEVVIGVLLSTCVAIQVLAGAIFFQRR